jgi:hypothetical protein
MGTAHIEVSRTLRWSILTDPTYTDLIGVITDTDNGDGTWLLKVRSPLLPAGYHGMQDLILLPTLGFKRSMDI